MPNVLVNRNGAAGRTGRPDCRCIPGVDLVEILVSSFEWRKNDPCDQRVDNGPFHVPRTRVGFRALVPSGERLTITVQPSRQMSTVGL